MSITSLPSHLLKWSQEIVVILVVLVTLSLVWRYRSRVLFLLTGDDKIHGSFLDCAAYMCRLCGDGECTRYLTSCSICKACDCYKRNLVKEASKCFGFATQPIELKNIVVGDLPYDSNRGDFYLCISVATNPDMVTALQEEKMPKIVHFPEILTLRLRDSALEPRVIITVKELNIAGSETLCELVLSASSIIDWAGDPEPLKRFQMRVLNSDIERETPPWIAVEFSSPTENRKLDALTNIWSALAVRTYLPPAKGSTEWHRTEQMKSMSMPNPHSQQGQLMPGKMGSTMLSDGTIMGTRTMKDMNIRQFKNHYQLLDNGGNPLKEPDEADLRTIRLRRKCVSWVLCLFDFIVFSLVAGYCGFRFYVWSCYRQFVWITEAKLNNATFPISNKDLHEIRDKCKAAVDGTGIIPGTSPCRPSEAQVLGVCNTLNETNRPEAFVGFVKDTFNAEIKGAPCFHGLCEFRSKLIDYDKWAVLIVIGLILSTRLCRCWADSRIKAFKKSCQNKNHSPIPPGPGQGQPGSFTPLATGANPAAAWHNPAATNIPAAGAFPGPPYTGMRSAGGVI